MSGEKSRAERCTFSGNKHRMCSTPVRLLSILLFFLVTPFFLPAQMLRIVTNQVGYESGKAKKAVIMAESRESIESVELVKAADRQVVYTIKPVYTGPVSKWKNWVFWTIDFSGYTQEGAYQLQFTHNRRVISSYPFLIGQHVLEAKTVSDVIYYFKGQRSSGLLDKADHHSPLAGRPGDTVDAHGGWYDATGDYGKHLSHLSFSSYFNPQQISLTCWGLLKSYEWLNARSGTDYRQYKRRLLDEAMYGMDYLTRVQVMDGSFFRTVAAPGPGKMGKDRVIIPEEKAYRIRQTKDQSLHTGLVGNSLHNYQCSYRSGGGVAIAALALASTYDTSGEFSNADYLRAAERAFDFLEKNNVSMTNDGKENIVDDYCALLAATELYKATHKQIYKAAADRRAAQLMGRLVSWKGYHDYWRADSADRPFFHPADAGLPIVSLLNYYAIASDGIQGQLKSVVRRSLEHELAITREVSNPFGYSRQLVEDTAGVRKSAYFFPHGSEASPWWQGENARLGSMATAARMAAGLFKDEPAFRDSLESYALDQLNWILGLNPYDASMLEGSGHNNPAYEFFGTFEYTNAPGGIVNGITSGLKDEDDIDFDLSYAQTHQDNDWRWVEQWLPHATWYLLAVSVNE